MLKLSGEIDEERIDVDAFRESETIDEDESISKFNAFSRTRCVSKLKENLF